VIRHRQLDSAHVPLLVHRNLVNASPRHSVNVQFIGRLVRSTPRGAGLAAGTQTFGIFFSPPTGLCAADEHPAHPRASAVGNASTLARARLHRREFRRVEAIDDAKHQRRRDHLTDD